MTARYDRQRVKNWKDTVPYNPHEFNYLIGNRLTRSRPRAIKLRTQPRSTGIALARGQDLHRHKLEGMPIDIRAEPICIATICIFGCSFVGNLASYAGCGNPLVVLFAVLIVGIILFELIHAIGDAAIRWAEAEIGHLKNQRATAREGQTFVAYQRQQ